MKDQESDRPVVFCCVACGREQIKLECLEELLVNRKPEELFNSKAGITVAEAKMIGWESTSRGWLCPFCAGRNILPKGI